MNSSFRYHRPGMRLEYYTEIYDYAEQHANVQAGEQPLTQRDLHPLGREDTLTFAADESDIRGFVVNTPTGNTIGTVVGFLADLAHEVVPYAYVEVEGGRVLIVPTNQFMIYTDSCLVTLDGGLDALRHAPEAEHNARDAERADHYWSTYRRQNAA
ncbi:MAG TPA: hypothetical protein VGL77_01200 [Armatimonadota bacterium]|jgi:hypothetical protein